MVDAMADMNPLTPIQTSLEAAGTQSARTSVGFFLWAGGLEKWPLPSGPWDQEPCQIRTHRLGCLQGQTGNKWRKVRIVASRDCGLSTSSACGDGAGQGLWAELRGGSQLCTSPTVWGWPSLIICHPLRLTLLCGKVARWWVEQWVSGWTLCHPFSCCRQWGTCVTGRFLRLQPFYLFVNTLDHFPQSICHHQKLN